MTQKIAAILMSFCVIVVPTRTWHGQNDNKSLAELEQMTESELAHEALFACLGSTATNLADDNAASIQKEALTYITTISRYGRRQNRGTTPWWVIAMYDAAQVGDSAQCQGIWQVVRQVNTEEAKNGMQKEHRNAWTQTGGSR